MPAGIATRRFGHDFSSISIHPPAGAAAGVKALPTRIRAGMERSFGVDFGGVRVRDDSAAKNSANEMNAKAFVEGGHIFWGSSAPPLESPEAAHLLAHEISHVVQQRQASSLEDRISSPGEASEIAANAAARQALAGQTAGVGGSSVVAATQRQPKNDTSTGQGDKEIEIERITAYLQKVVKSNPRQNLKQLKVVRDALKMLLNDAPLDVDKFLDSSATPSDPAELAKLFADKLPPIPKAALDKLLTFRVGDDPKGTVERVGDVVSKSKPGSGNETKVPGDVSPQDKADDLNRRLGGPETHIADFDIWRLLRIGKGLGPALNNKPSKAATPPADLDPAVAAAIDTIDKGALLPAEAKVKGQDSGEWVDNAQAFAITLAQMLDGAQKSNQEEIYVNLPPAYAGVKDRAVIMAALQYILTKLREARQDHASKVKRVIVRVGDSKRAWLVITT